MSTIDTKKVIVVVEDEKPLLDAIQAKLEKNGFSVVTARSVEEAFNHMQDIGHIDAVWLDHYVLGTETGLDFVIRCKSEDSPYRDIPVFVVSNTATPDKIHAYIKLGIQRYFVKSEKRIDNIIEEIRATIEKGIE